MAPAFTLLPNKELWHAPPGGFHLNEDGNLERDPAPHGYKWAYNGALIRIHGVDIRPQHVIDEDDAYTEHIHNLLMSGAFQ